MKKIKIGKRHYIWRPQVLALNLGRALFMAAVGAFYAYTFILAIGGLR